MTNWRQVAIPPKMKFLQKDRRGYPIPFSIHRDKNRIPIFTKHDATRLAESILLKRCSICGSPLESDIWFVSGANVALHSDGGFVDPPMHKECSQYALRVCPYLAIPSMIKQSPNQHFNQASTHLLTGKPTVFALSKTNGYRVLSSNGILVSIPNKPLLDIEYWRSGVQITWDEAKKLLT